MLALAFDLSLEAWHKCSIIKWQVPIRWLIHDPCEITQEKCLSIRGLGNELQVVHDSCPICKKYAFLLLFFLHPTPQKAFFFSSDNSFVSPIRGLQLCAFDLWWTASRFLTFNTNKCFWSVWNQFSQVEVLLIAQRILG